MGLVRQLLGPYMEAVSLFGMTLLIVLIGYVFYRRRSSDPGARTLAKWMFVCCLLLLTAVTLMPSPMRASAWDSNALNLIPGRTLLHGVGVSTRVGKQFLAGNVLVFAALGALARLTWRWSVRAIIVRGLLLSTSIELLQLVLPLGRSTDVDDVLLNVAGAALGAVFAAQALRVE